MITMISHRKLKLHIFDVSLIFVLFSIDKCVVSDSNLLYNSRHCWAKHIYPFPDMPHLSRQRMFKQ